MEYIKGRAYTPAGQYGLNRIPTRIYLIHNNKAITKGLRCMDAFAHIIRYITGQTKLISRNLSLPRFNQVENLEDIQLLIKYHRVNHVQNLPQKKAKITKFLDKNNLSNIEYERLKPTELLITLKKEHFKIAIIEYIFRMLRFSHQMEDEHREGIIKVDKNRRLYHTYRP